MSSSLRRFAPFGLYLAGLAAVVAVGFFIVQREFSLAIQICLGLTVLGLLLFVILDPHRVRAGLTGRQGRYGSNALIVGLAFIGILVVLNYLVVNNPQRWDLTENQQYTLAPETIQTIQSMPRPVKVLAFYTPRLSSDRIAALLDQYKFNSDGRIEYEFINPETDPLTAQQYQIRQDGTLVVIMGENHELITLADEREITGALVRLLNPGTRMVYFLTGHGELGLEAGGEGSYSTAKSTLEAKNYSIEPLNLVSNGRVPDDAEVLVIAGAIKPLSAAETDAIKAFLEKGGSLVLLAEPLPVTQFDDASDPLTDYLGQAWGIQLGRDMVVDLSSNQPFVAVSSEYGNSIITDKLQGLLTFYPTARSVTAMQDASGPRVTDLVLTSDQSWAETDLASLQAVTAENPPQIQPDEGQDIMGPISVAATGENADSGARVVVFGDSEFASDTYFTQYGNGDILINAVDWAAEQENLISLTPKEDIQRLLLPPGRYTMNLILLGSVFILPGIILLAGGLVWLQRRRRG